VDIEAILDGLVSKSLGEQVAASQALQALGPEAARRLIHLVAHSHSEDPRARLARELLVNWSDVQAVGAFAEAIHPPTLPYYVISPLERLLPRLTGEDARLLDSVQRERLHSLLYLQYAERYPGLLIAIIEGLLRIRDEAALPSIRRLAESFCRQQVRSAAQEGLKRWAFGREECIGQFSSALDRPRGDKTER